MYVQVPVVARLCSGELIALPISSAWMSNIFAASASLDICLVGVLYRCIFTVSIHCLSA
jgi:hypothetical protein